MEFVVIPGYEDGVIMPPIKKTFRELSPPEQESLKTRKSSELAWKKPGAWSLPRSLHK